MRWELEIAPLTLREPCRMVLTKELHLDSAKSGIPAGRQFKMPETNSPPSTVLLFKTRQREWGPFPASKSAR
jgi:hypothetical protein